MSVAVFGLADDKLYLDIFRLHLPAELLVRVVRYGAREVDRTNPVFLTVCSVSESF